MATYSAEVMAILGNKGKVKKEELVFLLAGAGLSFEEAKEAVAKEGKVVRRGKGGRAGFYDWLREGNMVRNEKELAELMDSGEIPFSDNEKIKSNYGHWLAIAELVDSVRENG